MFNCEKLYGLWINAGFPNKPNFSQLQYHKSVIIIFYNLVTYLLKQEKEMFGKNTWRGCLQFHSFIWKIAINLEAWACQRKDYVEV